MFEVGDIVSFNIITNHQIIRKVGRIDTIYYYNERDDWFVVAIPAENHLFGRVGYEITPVSRDEAMIWKLEN